MELLKLGESTARYQWQDVTFIYRTKVTTADKFEVDTAGALMRDGKITFTPFEFYRALIRSFVVGWEGVTENGKALPYSYESLLLLPSDTESDLIMKLGIKIAQDTGFIAEEKVVKAEADLKNA